MVAPDEQRMLQDLVLRRMPHLVDRAEERGGFVPSHVVRYLDRFGNCGDPNLGFALLRCTCGLAKVVPFRCHARALCPTCGGRANVIRCRPARTSGDGLLDEALSVVGEVFGEL